MKTISPKMLAASLGAATLALSLCACSPVATPEEELSSRSSSYGYIAPKTFQITSLGQTWKTDLFEISFDSAEWSMNYLPASESTETNLLIKGTFYNSGMDRYRINSSTETYFELDNTYFLRASADIVEDDVIRSDEYVNPGETVEFIVRTNIPQQMKSKIDNAVVTWTAYKADFNNGNYATHSSEPLQSLILLVEKDQIAQ